jgi:hypothetical protein
LHLRPQYLDQGIFFGVAQMAEVGKPEHAPIRIDSTVTASTPFSKTVRTAPNYPAKYGSTGVEQILSMAA